MKYSDSFNNYLNPDSVESPKEAMHMLQQIAVTLTSTFALVHMVALGIEQKNAAIYLIRRVANELFETLCC